MHPPVRLEGGSRPRYDGDTRPNGCPAISSRQCRRESRPAIGYPGADCPVVDRTTGVLPLRGRPRPDGWQSRRQGRNRLGDRGCRRLWRDDPCGVSYRVNGSWLRRSIQYPTRTDARCCRGRCHSCRRRGPRRRPRCDIGRLTGNAVQRDPRVHRRTRHRHSRDGDARPG